MDFENIVVDKDKKKGIVRLIINRPEVENALNMAARQELRSAIEDIKSDGNVRVVIITGAGDKAFSSGADITELKQASPIQMEQYACTLGQQLFTDIESLYVPVIAMINGVCLGAGCELAMVCDIRIASANSRFGQPEINIGIIPGSGGTQRLPRLVGWGKAKELIYTGRIIDAGEAERIGLVDKVVQPDKLQGRVKELAETIAGKSQLIIRLAKKAVNKGIHTDLVSGLSYERDNFALCFATKDQKEGMAAFLEKRKAEFKGE
jgi:enoyl-CoA hydratase